MVIHSSKEALHQSPLTFRSEQISLEPFTIGRIMVLRAITQIVRVLKYVSNGTRDLVPNPFKSIIYVYTQEL